tara:strand:+ start:811 stop:996 length:186 start_codon:yes stop_codon:yes gene_type:complete
MNKANEVGRLKERIAELEDLCTDIHKDLLMRAEEDSNGFKVVAVGSSVWLRLKRTLLGEQD